MTIHPLKFHFGNYLPYTPATLATFAVQFTQHLNTMLSETGRPFGYSGFDSMPLPGPNGQPAILPDQHAVDLFFYPTHATRSGTWDIDDDGAVQIMVPMDSLWLVGPDSRTYEGYVTTLAKFIHEWEHARGIRGEPYLTKNADPPADVPLPRINSWAFPHDVFWNERRRREMHDPAYTTRPLGYAPIASQPQDLAWVLANIRPCPGNAAIIRGPYRAGPPWEKDFTIAVTPPAHVRAWAVPGDYHDPWFEQLNAAVIMDSVDARWSDREHGYPLMGIRVDSEQHPPCTGYISIWELEWCAIAGIDPVVTCDPIAGTLSLPSPNWPAPPPPRPPWESDPRWSRAQWWQKSWIIASWLRTHRS